MVKSCLLTEQVKKGADVDNPWMVNELFTWNSESITKEIVIGCKKRFPHFLEDINVFDLAPSSLKVFGGHYLFLAVKPTPSL